MTSFRATLSQVDLSEDEMMSEEENLEHRRPPPPPVTIANVYTDHSARIQNEQELTNEDRLLNHIDQLEKVLNLYRSKEAVLQNNELLQLRKAEVELRAEVEDLRASKEFQTANIAKMNTIIAAMKDQAVQDIQEITYLKAHLQYDTSLTVPDLRCFINAMKMKKIENIDDLAAAWQAKQANLDDTLDQSKLKYLVTMKAEGSAGRPVGHGDFN